MSRQRQRRVLPRDMLEQYLVDSWARTLDVPSPSIDAAFAELGGSAGDAGTIVHDLERHCAITLHPDALAAHTRIRDLAWALREQGRARSSAPCRSFAAAPGALPFFYLHGDPNGGGHYCARLAAALGPDVALHALAACGPLGPAPLASVEAMATHHLRALRAVQPRGSYWLGGYCLGGIIGVEMARQLSAEGEQVKGLVLIGPRVWSRYWPLRRGCIRLQSRLSSWLPSSQGVIDRAYLATLERTQPGFARWDRWRLRNSPEAERVPPGAGPARNRRPGSPTLSDPRERERLEFWHQLVGVARLHVPRRWDGPAVILWPEGEQIQRCGDPEASWRGRLPQFRLREIPGDHDNALVRHVDAAAAALRQVLLESP